jgi:hypothetical protein
MGSYMVSDEPREMNTIEHITRIKVHNAEWKEVRDKIDNIIDLHISFTDRNQVSHLMLTVDDITGKSLRATAYNHAFHWRLQCTIK